MPDPTAAAAVPFWCGSGARFRCPAAVGIAATGPLAIGALRAVLPYATTDETPTVLAGIAANPGRENTVLWLTYLAALTLPLGVLMAARLAVRARPVLGTVGAALSWCGFISLFVSVTIGDYAGLAVVRARVPEPIASRLVDAVGTLPATATASLVFVVGHIVGGLLLAAALWRVIPVWAALALAVSLPLHLVCAVIVPSGVLDAGAWALTALGLAVAAAVLTRPASAAVLTGPDS